MLNRKIDEEKLKKISSLNFEKITEFISTNNIEGDIIKFHEAKKLIKTNLTDTQMKKRWIGIKYAHSIIWSNNFELNLEYLHEAIELLWKMLILSAAYEKQK